MRVENDQSAADRLCNRSAAGQEVAIATIGKGNGVDADGQGGRTKGALKNKLPIFVLTCSCVVGDVVDYAGCTSSRMDS
jgi:hypothetical protein